MTAFLKTHEELLSVDTEWWRLHRRMNRQLKAYLVRIKRLVNEKVGTRIYGVVEEYQGTVSYLSFSKRRGDDLWKDVYYLRLYLPGNISGSEAWGIPTTRLSFRCQRKFPLGRMNSLFNWKVNEDEEKIATDIANWMVLETF